MRTWSPYTLLLTAIIALLTGCNATRHVPEGEYLLDKSTITIVGDSAGDVKPSSLRGYLRQSPNHQILGCARLQLGIYNLSGRDSTRWVNRWIRRLGEAPVIYDDELTDQSARQLRQAMINRGYSNVAIETDTTVDRRRRRVRVDYRVTPGSPQILRQITYNVADTALRTIMRNDSAHITLLPGSPFDRNALDAERTRLTTLIRNHGYYAFVPEHISFVADTSAYTRDVDLELILRDPKVSVSDTVAPRHRRYIVDRVYINTEADAPASMPLDTVMSHGYYIIYGPTRYLKPDILSEKCYIDPGQLYSATNVDRTYEAFSRLGILKYVNISFKAADTFTADGDIPLVATVSVSRTRTQTVIFELEGTNSEGDLGVGAGVTYQHRNLAKRSELLSVKLRGSYESLSGNLEGLINNRFTEIGAEVGITFPSFKAPILRRSFRQRIKASTEFSATFNRQERPEYTRIIAGAGMKYKWNNRNNTSRRTLDLIDINFVSLPRSTIDFINNIAPTNPLLRYSYEDHLIMRMGYTYYRTNRTAAFNSAGAKNRTPGNIYTFRFQGETAGNILYAIASATHMRRHEDAYKVLGIQFSQYVKGTIGYTYNHYFNSRNSMSWHIDGGIAYPYGNSSMVPFEKRFYAGGANSVRGWGVRTLGPGCYNSRNSVSNFINQCGDISLFTSMEYRARLFWVLEGALFVDAGNIWTIHDYENQPGGMFKFDEFYKQIALGYGLGIRLDFTYFLLRLDLGMKAHNPAADQRSWPLLDPSWRRDATIHFSVGYPF